MQSATNKATATVPVRYEALDGFRGVLALLVCLHHILVSNSLFQWSRYLHPILDLFFLLSGFVLAMTYDTRIRNGRSFADFFVRRAGRLWPAHLCVLGVMVGLETIRAIRGYMFDRSDIVTFTGTKTLGSAVENFFLVQGWGYNKPFTWNVPSWTLSTELIAYALLGLILLSTTRKSLRIAAALLLATSSTALLAYQTDFMRRAPNVNVAWCLQGFFFGYVLYHVWHRWPIASRWWGTAAEVGLLVACTVMLSFKVTGFIMFVWLACAVALLHALASGKGVVSSFLRLKPMLWLGQISLSVYLVHYPLTELLYTLLRIAERNGWIAYTQRGGALDFGSRAWMDAFTLAYLAIAIALGALLYYWVEVPSRKWSASLAGRIGRGEFRWRSSPLTRSLS